MDFYEVFRDLLKLRKLTHAGFAGKVGVTPAFISQVATRRSKPPIDRIEDWANALDLRGSERQTFLDLAAITTLPDAAQPRFIRILEGFEASEANRKALVDRVEALEAQRKGRGK